jgi:hypothetical protein
MTVTMVKTTLYLPEDLKRAVELEAKRSGAFEAVVMREALRDGLSLRAVRPRGALFAGAEPIARRADEFLAGFGE